MTMTKRICTAFAACVCALALAAGLGLACARAAWADTTFDTTAVYTVPATSSYYNPVTGEVEDSAGDSNTALGESMVEGVAYENVLVEVDSDGNVWVTMRLRLADQLGDVAVEVDDSGDGNFAATEATEMQTAVENEGEDTETQLIDYRFQVPDTSSYTRVSMYVDPMGRDVVFFLILDFDGAVEGNTDAIAFVESVVAGEAIAGSAEEEEEDAGEDDAATADDAADDAADDDAAVDDTAATDDAAAVESEEESGASMLPIVVAVVIALIVIAVLLWYFMAYRPKHAAQASAAAAAATGTAAAAAAAAASKKTHPALQKDAAPGDGAPAGADAPAGDARKDA